jgi:hypothetical protein
MTIFKRAAILSLAIAVITGLTSCTFTRTLKGFRDAAVYMNGEPNIKNQAVISVKLSEDATPKNLSQFISEIRAESPLAGGLAGLAVGTEINLSAVTEVYDGNISISLGWVEPDGKTETLMTLIYHGGTLYASTELLGLIGSIQLSGKRSANLARIDCDYIKFSLDALPDLFERFTGTKPNMSMLPMDFGEALEELDTLLEAIGDNLRKILTKECRGNLTRDGAEYTLTLDRTVALAMYDRFISLTDYEDTFSDKYRDGIPRFDAAYTVSGTGKRSAKVRSSSFSVSSAADGLPFFTVGGAGVTTVMTGPIEEPSGKTLTVEQLIMQIMWSVIF